MDGALVIFSRQLSGSLCTVWPTHCAKQSFVRTECSAFSWHSFLICCVLCSRCTTKNNRLHRRNSRQFFDTPLWLAGYCAAVLLRKNVICMGGTLAIFFADHLWPAFAVPLYTEITWHLVMISHSNGSILRSFWRHFGVILGSFWGPKWSNGPILRFWDQSGINLGSRGASRPKFHHLGPPVFGPFLDHFSTSFVFAWKYVKFGVQILVIVFWMIFERFWGDFQVTFGGQKWSKV